MSKTATVPAPMLNHLGPDGKVITTQTCYHAHKDPRYLAAEAKIAEVQHRAAVVNAAIQEELTRVVTARSMSRRQEEAHSIVYDTPLPPEEGPADMTALYKERALLQEAVILARKRSDDVANEVSTEICKTLRDTYATMCKDLFPALRELRRLYEIERSFMSELEAGGTRFVGLPPIGLVGLGHGRLVVAEEEMIKEVRFHYGLDLAG